MLGRSATATGGPGVTVAVGRQNVTWGFVHAATQVEAEQVEGAQLVLPHASTGFSVLVLTGDAAVMTVPAYQAGAGLHPYRFAGKGVWGTRLAAECVFARGAGPFAGAEEDFADVVVGSTSAVVRFQPGAPGPAGWGGVRGTGGYGAVLEAALRFDLDGDGELCLEEFKAFWTALCGRLEVFALSGAAAHMTVGTANKPWVDNTGLKVAQGQAGRAVDLTKIPEAPAYDELGGVAGQMGVALGPGGGIPIWALPRIVRWAAKQGRPDATDVWAGRTRGQDALVGSPPGSGPLVDTVTAFEAAVLARLGRLVAVKHGRVSAAEVSPFDAQPDACPSKKITKAIRAVSVLVTASNNPAVQAKAAELLGSIKQAAMTGAPLAQGAKDALGKAMAAVAESAPDLLAGAQGAIAEAAAAAPELLGPLMASAQEAAEAAAALLAAAGKSAAAAAVAARPALASILAHARNLGGEVGAEAAEKAAAAQAYMTTGKGGAKLRSFSGCVGGGDDAVAAEPDAVEVADIDAGAVQEELAAAVEQLSGKLTLAGATQLATTVAAGAASAGAYLVGAAPGILQAAQAGAEAGVGAVKALASQVDPAATAAALQAAGAAVGGPAMEAAKAAQGEALGALTRLLAVARRAGVVVSQEATDLARGALAGLVRITPEQVKDILVPAFRQISAVVPRQLLGDVLGRVQGIATACAGALVDGAGEIKDAVSRLPWDKVGEVKDDVAVAGGKLVAAASDSAGALRSGLAEAAAAAGALARLVADSDAVAALGGVATSAAIVAEASAAQLASAAAAGAKVSVAAIAGLRAQAPVALAAARAAAAEMRAHVAVALQAAVAAGRDAVQWVSAIETDDVLRALATSAEQARALAGAAVQQTQAAAVLAMAQFNVVRAEAAVLASAAAEAAAAAGAVIADVSADGLKEAAALAKVSAAASMKAAAQAQEAAAEAGAAAYELAGQVARSDEFRAAAAAAKEGHEQLAALTERAIAAAGPALERSAKAVAAGVANTAGALRDTAMPLAAAGARATMAAVASGAALAKAGLQSAFAAAMQHLPGPIATSIQRGVELAVAAGAMALKAVQAAATAAYEGAIAAGKALAPVAKALAPYGSAVAGAAVAVGGSAAAGAMAAAGFVSETSGDVVAAVAENAGPAAAALREGAVGAMTGAYKGAVAVGDAVATGGAAAGAAIAAAAGAVDTTVIRAAVSDGLEAGADFWQSAVAQGAKVVDFESVGKLYSDARGTLNTALAAAAGAAVSLFSLIKLEVLRDFFQLLGLFVANLASGAMEVANVVFGRIANIISFDFGFALPEVENLIVVVYVLIGIAAVIITIAYLWVLYTTADIQVDVIRQGKEAEGFDKLAETRKRTITAIKYILTAAMSAYLPVSRSALQILICDGAMGKALKDLGAGITCKTIPADGVAGTRFECECSEWDYIGLAQAVSVILLIVFTLGLPLQTYRLIQANKPFGSREDPDKRYDEDGELVDYSEAMYQTDLTTDPKQLNSPYLFLYKGYERKWAFFKVIIMVVKLLFAIILIALFKDAVLQGVLTLVLMGLFTAFNFFTSPLLNPQADVMESSGRVTNFFVALFGFLGSSAVSASLSGVMGILINIVNAINAVVMILAVLYGIRSVRDWIKSTTGAVHFDDTVLNREGRFDQVVVSREDGTLTLNLLKEVKHRIWHPFWLSLIINGNFSDGLSPVTPVVSPMADDEDEEDKSDAEEEAPKPEKAAPNAVAQRLVELQSITADVGRKRIVDHFKYAAERGAERAFIMNEVEGVDAFWDGIPHDGELNSETCFAKAIVHTYPFHVVLAYDDDDDYTFLWEEDLMQFAAKQRDPEIMRRKHVRHQLRAAAMVDGTLHLEFERWEKRTVEDGTETYRDSEGNTKTRTVYSTIDVLMHYHNGRVGVGAKDKKKMARGFDVTMTYNDGHGEARKPRTGQMAHFSNEHATIGHAELNIDSQFHQQGKLNELLTDPANVAKIQIKMPVWTQQCQAYRARYRQAEARKEKILSSAFWLYVFDNVDAGLDRLNSYFSTWEQNPAISAIPQEHAKGIQFVMQRMEFVKAHPCNALWFVFWDSVWENNNTLSVISEAAPLLDPKSSDALAYRPMPRDKLQPMLEEAGLCQASTCWSAGFINEGMLDKLYELMDHFNQEAMQGVYHWGAGIKYTPAQHEGATANHPLHGDDVTYDFSGKAAAGAGGAMV